MTRIAPICYVEIPAPDPELAAAFYEAVFGWASRPSGVSSEPYWIFETFGEEEEGISGGFDPSLDVQPGGVILYLSVDDCDETLEAVKGNGGEVVRPKKTIGGDYGYTALFKDPNGNRVGVWSRH